MKANTLPVSVLSVVLICTSGFARRTSSDTESDQLVQQVFVKLLAVPAAARPATAYDTWPPKALIIDSVREEALARMAGDHNAFAYAPDCVPQIRLTDGLMRDVVQGDADRLALILGHELSHLLLGHTPCTRAADKSPVSQAAFTRAQEFAADQRGMELALAAGYSVRNGFKALERLSQISDYSSFEALTADHPSWAERLARLDSAQASLWRSMSAFEDGVYFLETENYDNAERCFRGVVTEFPEADDGWANLGYAALMQYADKLTTENLRSLGIGQIVAGAFYSSPVWLSGKVRGVDAQIWGDAVYSLNQADKLNATLALVKANLGVAYLLHPTGKDTQRAITYFEAAASLLQKKSDQSLAAQARSDPRTPVLGVANNLAVAYAAAGRTSDAAQILESISKIGFAQSVMGFLQSEALMYNYSMLLAGVSDPRAHRQAREILEQYLGESSASSSWWPIAYDQYAALSKELSVASKTQDQLQRSTHRIFREIDSVDLGGGRVITLGEKLANIQQAGSWQEVSEVTGTKLRRLRLSFGGLDVLADSDQVLAIFLHDPKGPTLPIRGVGMETKTDQLHVGMNADDIDKILQDQPYRFESLTDTWSPYRFYPHIGIAMMTGPDRTVTELVVVQTTRR